MPRTRKLAELTTSGGINLATADIRVALLTGSPALTQGIEFMDDSVITGSEHDDASYAREALADVALSWDEDNDRLEFTHSNVNFGALDGATPTYAVYYYHRGSDDSANEVLGYFDIADVAPDGVNDYILTVGAEGTIWF